MEVLTPIIALQVIGHFVLFVTPDATKVTHIGFAGAFWGFLLAIAFGLEFAGI